MIRLGRIPFFHARAYTAAAESIAPMKATGVSRSDASGMKISIMTPARPAPEETPTMPGSASGFFITACRIAPDTARLAPTSAPTIFRGNRIFQMTISSVVWTFPMSVCMITSKEISADPKRRLAIMAKTVNTAKQPMIATRSALLFPVSYSPFLLILPPHRTI